MFLLDFHLKSYFLSFLLLLLILVHVLFLRDFTRRKCMRTSYLLLLFSLNIDRIFFVCAKRISFLKIYFKDGDARDT